MGYVDLLDYINASKSEANKDGGIVRFRLSTLDDGKLVLTRNKKSEYLDIGTISAGLVHSGKDYSIIHMDALPQGIVKIDDVKDLLKGTRVRVADNDLFADISRVGGVNNFDLDDSLIEYANDEEGEFGNTGNPNAIIIPLLKTAKHSRKLGLARDRITDVTKYASINGYDYMYGIGSPLEPIFWLNNLTQEEKDYFRNYAKMCSKKKIPNAASIINLAIFYKRLGFEIYPLGQHFMIRKDINERGNYTPTDRAFFHNDTTTMDNDDIVLGK